MTIILCPPTVVDTGGKDRLSEEAAHAFKSKKAKMRPPEKSSDDACALLVGLSLGDERKMKAVVDKGICQGHGLCVLYAPDLFVLDDETGLAVVAAETIDSSKRTELIEAVNSCPVKAITLIEN